MTLMSSRHVPHKKESPRGQDSAKIPVIYTSNRCPPARLRLSVHTNSRLFTPRSWRRACHPAAGEGATHPFRDAAGTTHDCSTCGDISSLESPRNLDRAEIPAFWGTCREDINIIGQHQPATACTLASRREDMSGIGQQEAATAYTFRFELRRV